MNTAPQGGSGYVTTTTSGALTGVTWTIQYRKGSAMTAFDSTDGTAWLVIQIDSTTYLVCPPTNADVLSTYTLTYDDVTVSRGAAFSVVAGGVGPTWPRDRIPNVCIGVPR